MAHVLVAVGGRCTTIVFMLALIMDEISSTDNGGPTSAAQDAAKKCKEKDSSTPVLMQRGIKHYRLRDHDVASSNASSRRRGNASVAIRVNDTGIRNHTANVDSPVLSQQVVGDNMNATDLAPSSLTSQVADKSDIHTLRPLQVTSPVRAKPAAGTILEKAAIIGLDISGVQGDYCTNRFHDHSLVCELGAILLGLLVCAPIIALAVAAFWGIMTGFSSGHHH